MFRRRGQHPDSHEADNVDRRKGFLDIVERLGQGVAAVTPTDTKPSNDADDRRNDEPTDSAMRRTHRP
jgi:hypothetical protein